MRSTSRSTPRAILTFAALSALPACVALPAVLSPQPRCSPPSKGFTDATLAGTWIAGVPDQSDTLFIRSDRTYKQVIHVDFADGSPPLDYEGSWQGWRLEYSQDGIPYLHLDGYRFCGLNPSISCDTTSGDGYDVCHDQSITMQGEGILAVLETQADASPGQQPPIYYYLHYPLGSEDSWVYQLQAP
jgi:hypothetical protein